jgi:hypothetical protein
VPMTTNKLHWGRAVGGALLGEIAQVAASFVWVAIYSYIIEPGKPVSEYQRYAQVSGPWVSILAGAPIFFAVSVWIARSRRTALALFVVFLALDVALLVAYGEALPPSLLALAAASYLTKLAACYVGGWWAERSGRSLQK